jgi:CBS-domain-containing membrane protein
MRKRVDERGVGEIMTRSPVVVSPGTELRALKRMFQTHDFNMFPVVDGTRGLVGVISKLDILKVFRPDRRRLIPDVRALWAERAEDIMSRSVLSVGPDDAVTTVVDVMLEWKLRSLPVVERRGRTSVLVGVVSRTDVLQCLMLEDDDPD